MKMEIGKTYLVKKDILFVNDDKVKVFAVLQDSSEVDMQLYHHLDDYLEEVTHENF